MLKAFENHIRSHFESFQGKRLLVALSGGLDSVVLTHLCHALELDIALAHCNFNLRGAESDADEAFVLDLSDRLNVEVFIEIFDTEQYAETEKCSIQMAARQLRYDWFFGLAESLNFDYILTAHHADDNLETFLINLTRGSGLDGFTGIPERRGKLCRPLLPFSRDDLENYAKTNRLKWRDDSSNSSDKYLRNKLRHHVIPVLKEVNPSLLNNFKDTLSHLQGAAGMVQERLDNVTTKIIAPSEAEIKVFKIPEIKKLHPPKAYLYALLKDYGFTEWDDIVHLLDAQTGKQVFSKTHRLLKDRQHLVLSEHGSLNTEDEHPMAERFLIEAPTKNMKTPAGILLFDEADAITKTDKQTIFVDAGKLRFPLLLRKWEQGDVFFPHGMRGKKKLSKYFKDEKLSLLEKEAVWLLCSNDQIVWVIGWRGDERFKVSENSSNIYKITVR